MDNDELAMEAFYIQQMQVEREAELAEEKWFEEQMERERRMELENDKPPR